MKFERTLDDAMQRMPHYKECFLDYRMLKKRLKECAFAAGFVAESEDEEQEEDDAQRLRDLHPTEEEVRFFDALRQQMDRVGRAWEQRMGEVEADAKQLQDRIEHICGPADLDENSALLSSSDVPDATSCAASSSGPSGTAQFYRWLRGPLRRTQSTIIFSEYRALYARVLDVQELRVLACEAVRKILKKYDKHFPGRRSSAEQQKFMRFEVERRSFGTDDRSAALAHQVRRDLRRCFMPGSAGDQRFHDCVAAVTAERCRLQQQQKQRPSPWRDALRLYLGWGLACCLFFAWLYLYVGPIFRPNNPELNWQGYLVIFGVCTAIFLIAAADAPSDVCLMSATTLFCVTGIIPPQRAYIGFGNPGVIANGILLPFAKALMISGGAERMLTNALGGIDTNRNIATAQVRMCLVVATFSSVLNNTPIAFMMIPILQNWCTKIDHSVSRFMMPMSFAIMLGGTCSVIGSSANLVVIGIAGDFTGHYPSHNAPDFSAPAFFMPAWVGLPVCILGTLWMVATAPFLLPERIPRPSAEGAGSAGAAQCPFARGKNFSSCARFLVGFELRAPLVGQRVADTGITRLIPGVTVEYIQTTPEGPREDAALGGPAEPPHDPGASRRSRTAVSAARTPSTGTLLPADRAPTPPVARIAGADVAGHVISDGDLAVFHVSSRDVSTLRQVQGLRLTGKQEKLEIDRRNRCLLEATLGPGSRLVGTHVQWEPRSARVNLVGFDERRLLNACCVGVDFTPDSHAEPPRIGDEESPHVASSHSHSHSHPAGSPSDSPRPAEPPCGARPRIDMTRRRRLAEGDTLLVEGPCSAASRVWHDYFHRIVVVEDSMPPMRDAWREGVTLGSLALMVLVTAQGWADVSVVAFALVGVFLATGVLSPREAWSSVKGDVLLTVAASFGIGEALHTSGLATWLGGAMSGLSGGSELALLALLYLFTLLAGSVLNNAAVAVLVYPIAYDAAVEDFQIDPSMVVILVIMGAGLSFTTPMSYQTNQMVQQPGGYLFSDFVRFGGVLQLFTGVSSVVILYALANWGYIKHHHGLGPPPCAPEC
eukprot:TRINITY_DN18109_c0_g1_i1.p1 TRINITY_DN18109_c0_g1~~TRINITY_DN18109_c0_g1_i1.p1  ORF type:complete len:1081 (+),score=336.22 TRINITY_DN18109_c0_g1_i1:86-3244(+)